MNEGNKWTMNKAKNKKVVIGLALFLVLIIGTLFIFSNPLYRPPETIRSNLLSEIPLGSYRDEAVEFINMHEEWVIHSERFGNVRVHGRTIGDPTYYIRVHMGYYRFIFHTDVTAFWRFDEEGILIDIVVRKTRDVF